MNNLVHFSIIILSGTKEKDFELQGEYDIINGTF